MATYVVGDLQGCLSPLLALLESVNFNEKHDELWVTGDIVNRGPQSLQTLQFLYRLRHCVTAVLGNHDLHLLAVAAGVKQASRSDTLDNILVAHDREELLRWLRQLPLVHHCPDRAITMVHAGLPPQWSLSTALSLSAEIEKVLKDESSALTFYQNMYGNTPNRWDPTLEGFERLRLITNYCTRMRFCASDGTLELTAKGSPINPPEGYQPWYAHDNRMTQDDTLLFGHWAALEGKTGVKNAIGLDTGCVWGGCLTLLRLEDRQRFVHPCSKKA
ncbi:symmetrical bis(5'-nucleosyl)-tetraphosphatase [Marinibactrum halimedae]|uniref:Bis(5'-nucleosyl)-tetraphosphatase, symmetrical n=1 Tax=Marinibactrum halimedae TaxID=1444977 RepID=A0AA37WMX0_9GAMM|nr:symmetrical bis(5'-nucleosyl)-tetraphosphatase [Marinibactrum halimedae]MCD9459557.1 symmetrical bis(5'-nucleosyl)-tetraphosphatase [Marinibactrum halimedae]GLS25626.1 bis(5'-nucleosyl)-tetraphosphatase, symmetrical [Marinibactrum halimedae]